MLQKLENAYLAILRGAVIVASGILLNGFVIYSLAALKGFGDGPSEAVAPPKVNSDALVEKMTASKSMSEVNQNADERETSSPEAVEPNQKYYDLAAKTIGNYAVRVSGGSVVLDENNVDEIIKGRAESVRSEGEELIAAYAKGFSDAVGKVLADKKIGELARKSSAVDVVNQLLNIFSEEFNSQIQAEEDRIAAANIEHSLAKVESASNLYFAAACFGMFLLIVFLSIFIKIERNLRHLEVKGSVGA